ncbi:MAG: hypothetical protein ACREAC_10675, partial [Blastocatellia bacterium]
MPTNHPRTLRTQPDTPAPDSSAQSSESHFQDDEPVTPESELRLIVARSGSSPAPKDLARVRELLTQHPALWRIAGDPARRAASLTLDRSTLAPIEREGAIAGFSDILRSLNYDGGHPLACLLIDQVALRWLQLGALDHAYAHEKGLSLYERHEWEKRITAAHRRLTSSCVSLAQVQRLLSPAVPDHDSP